MHLNTSADDTDLIIMQCCLTISDDQKIDVTCTFENLQLVERRLLLCQMVESYHGKGCREGALHPDAPAFAMFKSQDQFNCVPSGSGGGVRSSLHLGCREITVAPVGDITVPFAQDVSFEPTGVRDMYAWDFQVSYADAWVLEPGATFDEQSCTGLAAQGAYLGIGGSADAPNATIWAAANTPFIDPFVAARASTAAPVGPTSQVDFDKLPCIPADATIDAGTFARCPAESHPIPRTVLLNLFYWESHLLDRTDQAFPTMMTLETDGDMSGLRLETEPKEKERFDILSGRMQLGSLRLCDAASTERCVAPGAAEGRELRVLVRFDDPDSGNPRFNEQVTFINDTAPPRVLELSATQLSAEVFALDVLALDETTVPVHVEAWFTLDDGQRWLSRTLTSTDGLSETTRRFVGTIDTAGQPTSVLLSVQDTVGNTLYFGPQALGD